MPDLAVIGLGGRIGGMVTLARELDPSVRIVAVADPDEAGARARTKVDLSTTRFFKTVDELVGAGLKLDGVLIGTQCHLHTDMACAVAPLGVPLFLEKPVATSLEQVSRLAAAWRGREDRVVVSFPLRHTPLFRAVHEIVRAGRLGTINQIQAINNVTYGGVYFATWYRDWHRSGGLWLQKATHDIDYISLLAGGFPQGVMATTTQRVYGGAKPHDLRCSACDETATCPESPRNQKLRGHDAGMGADDHWCAFSREIRNEDAGSALLMYEGGLHAAYAQNFVARRAAGARGARVIGFKGTIEFDWYSETYRFVDHIDDRVEQVKIKAAGGHGGGDEQLLLNFLDVVRGADRSRTDLHAGLWSAASCLAARESSETREFRRIAVEPAARATAR